MAEVALIAGLASAGASIFGGYSKMKEGKEADKIAGVNAGNLLDEGEAAYGIAKYNAAVQRQEGQSARDIALYNALVTKNDGDVAKATAEFKAMQLQRAAGEERAAGQISAREKRYDMQRVLSTQRARAAASGTGGISSAGVLDIMGDTIERGEYLAQLESYGGEVRARGKLDQAAAAKAAGEAARMRAMAAAYGIEMEGNAAFARGENAAGLSLLQGEAARKKAASAAEVARMQGKAAKTAGKNAMWGSILEGGGKALTAGASYFGGGTGGYDPLWRNTATTRFR